MSVKTAVGKRLKTFFSLAVAVVLIVGSAMIGVWRSQQEGMNPGSEPIAQLLGVATTPVLSDSASEPDDDDTIGDPPTASMPSQSSQPMAIAPDGSADVDKLSARVSRAIEKRKKWRRSDFAALEQLARLHLSTPTDASKTALQKVVSTLRANAEPNMASESIEPVTRLSDVLGSELTLFDGGTLLRERLRIAVELESTIGQVEEALALGDAARRRDMRRAAQALQGLAAADRNQPRVLQLLDQLEAALLARALRAADTFAFDDAQAEYTLAAELRTDSSAVDRARIELAARKAEAEAALLRQVEEAFSQRNVDGARIAIERFATAFAQPAVVDKLQQRLANLVTYGGFSPGETFSDKLSTGGRGPRLRVVPAGRFVMGSKASEEGRDASEGPQFTVEFERGFGLGLSEVTVGEFAEFVTATGYQTLAEKQGHSFPYDEKSGRLSRTNRVNWRDDYVGRRAKNNQPVVHVAFADAIAYAAWLSEVSGASYRLPSESEFEYTVRGGTTTRYWWGDSAPTQLVENLTGDGDRSPSGRTWNQSFRSYSDKYWGPAPVRSLSANPLGFFDLAGNVSEWVEDCWHDSYARAPKNGKAWVNRGCTQRVLRGGSWGSSPADTRSAARAAVRATSLGARIGFRVARDLETAAVSTPEDQPAAVDSRGDTPG